MINHPITYRQNTSTSEEIFVHLMICDSYFFPKLSSTINLKEYAEKLFKKSTRIECWKNEKLIGIVSFYTNQIEKFYYITNVSVDPDYQGLGIAKNLLKNTINYCENSDLKKILLEVNPENQAAMKLYTKAGFLENTKNSNKNKTIILEKNLNDMNENKRNYNLELQDTSDHKYAYNFDFDVMHKYMVDSFIPFFKEGNLLELGSFKGDFTRRLTPFFDDITCVEASDDAIEIAKKEFRTGVKFVNSLFEEVNLPEKYDNVVLTHVLEHIDDPVKVLKRINDEWLSEKGRFYLVCPNANAPSRQIAVKMGLISHNSAITPAEKEHGHRITYSLDTLERDATQAGLKVIHRSGIFFKALANFQWDQLLNTDIISQEYLDGCFQLGQIYPDLCSSIFLVCEKG